jgi:hypothetical protein
MLQPVTGIFMAGMLAISSSSAIGEKVILRQGFEKFDENFDKFAHDQEDYFVIRTQTEKDEGLL